jgi:4-aminobutyrate aminotransferase-like enzyme
MVAYFNSGGDAISVALRAAEKFARQNGRNGRKVAVAFREAYHGNIEGRAGAVTGGINEVCDDQEKRALILEYPNLPEETEPVLEQLVAAVERNEVAAIVFEARQGDGGGVGMHPDFFVEMVKLSLDREIPLVCDEVQSGFGRTGRLWAVDFLLDHWQQSTYVQSHEYHEDPQMIVAVAKSLTNGAFPGSAVIFPEQYAVLERAQGLNTYSAHPGTLGAAYITCQLMKDPALPLMVARNRAAFESVLEPFIGEDKLIKGIRGEGLFLFLALDESTPFPGYPRIGNNQLMQAELIGTQRVLTGTVARNALRVHLPLNAPEIVHQATAYAIGKVAERIEQGQWDPTSAYVLKTGGPSGLAER